MNQVTRILPMRRPKFPFFSTHRHHQSTSDPRTRVTFTRFPPIGLTSSLSLALRQQPTPIGSTPTLVTHARSLRPANCATSAPLTVDQKFDQVHFNLFSRPESIFAICFSIWNLDMPGDEISRPIHVLFYRDNFAQWS